MKPFSFFRLMLLVWLILAICWALGCSGDGPTAPRALAATPVPTPAVAHILCSYQGGAPVACSCPNGEATCQLPPGWTVVCEDANGQVVKCPWDKAAR